MGHLARDGDVEAIRELRYGADHDRIVRPREEVAEALLKWHLGRQIDKFYSSEGGLRVPLVIAGPGVTTRGVEDAPVHVADLMPTLLDAAGVAYDASSLYGQSVLPVLTGEADETRGPEESFGVEVSGNAALYRGNWKLVRTALPRGDFTWRLFDLSIDPGETTDLSGENPELFADMRAEYEA